jgi:uncharacterized damage-inducible protein DinB
MFAYNQWARSRLLEQVAKLSQDDYTAPRGLDYGSIRATLVHNLSAEAGYLARWQGATPERSIDEASLPTCDTLRERWNAEQSKIDAFLAKLIDADLRRELRFHSAQANREFVHPLWAYLTQCINHSTQHRSEIALTTTQLGLSPGNLDLIVYLREHPVAGSQS